MKRIGMAIGQLAMGGAERQLYETCIRLPEEGFEPIVYCLSDRTDPYGPLLEQAGVQVRLIERSSHLDLRRGLNLRRMVRRDGIHLLHSWLIDDNPYAYLATAGTPVHFIASLRSRPTHRDGFRKMVDRYVFHRAARVIVNGAEVREHLERTYGVPTSRVELVENGVDFDRLTPTRSRTDVRNKWGAGPEDALLLFIGRLHPVKRLNLLIEALRFLNMNSPVVRLWIVGEGEERESLESLTNRLGLRERVTFLGNQTEVGDLYASADLFVLPSESEGMPNVVIEAMAARLPALVSDEAGCGTVIESEKNGWIFTEGSVEPLAKTLRKILDNPEMRVSVATAGQRTILDRFSVERMSSSFCEIYGDVLAGNH